MMIEFCPVVRRLFVQDIHQCVHQWVMVTFGGHLCLLWHCLYLSLWIEVFYKAHSSMCYSIPLLVLWMLCEQAAKWFQAAGLLCSWCAMFAALVHRLMIAVTCTWGIHQHSGVKKVLYSLLQTVNNELMCKSWLLWSCCSTSRIATCRAEAALPDNFVMHWLIAISGVGRSSGKYYNSWSGVDVYGGFPEYCLAKLREHKQWIFNSN